MKYFFCYSDSYFYTSVYMGSQMEARGGFYSLLLFILACLAGHGSNGVFFQDTMI